MKELKVKAWVIDKAQLTATRYNCFIDYSRRNEADGRRVEEDGYTYVIADEIISETEKAMQVKLRTGSVVGSYKGWKLWIPKSQIA